MCGAPQCVRSLSSFMLYLYPQCKPWCWVNLHQCINLFRSLEEEDPVWRACNGPSLNFSSPTLLRLLAIVRKLEAPEYTVLYSTPSCRHLLSAEPPVATCSQQVSLGKADVFIPQDSKTSRVDQNWKGTRFNKSGDGLRKKKLGRNKSILWASKVVQQVNVLGAKPEIWVQFPRRI